MKAATEFFLTISDFGKIVVEYAGTHGGVVSRVVTSKADLRNFLTSKAAEAKTTLDKLTVLSGSALDFPKEFTTNEDVIALAAILRS